MLAVRMATILQPFVKGEHIRDLRKVKAELKERR